MGSRARWGLLLAPVVAWAAQEGGSALLVVEACRAHRLSLGRVGLGLLGLLALGVSATSALLSVQHYRAIGTWLRHEDGHERDRLLAFFGVVLGLALSLAIVWTALPTLLISDLRGTAVTARALLCACLLGALSCQPETGVERSAVVTGGNAERGAAAIRARGCGACHCVPGIRGASGQLAASLAGFSRRSFIAGGLPNVPENLQRWLMDPPAIDPHTAMPKLGIESEEARDITAYLYALD